MRVAPGGVVGLFPLPQARTHGGQWQGLLGSAEGPSQQARCPAAGAASPVCLASKHCVGFCCWTEAWPLLGAAVGRQQARG